MRAASRGGRASAVSRWWLLAGAVLAGCGGKALTTAGQDAAAGPGDATGLGPNAVVAPIRSGTRLRARWTVSADGRRAFRGWFDTQLAAPCLFGTAADGELRCVPDGALTAAPTPTGGGTFGDAACTRPAIVSGRTAPGFHLGFASCAPPEFIQQFDFSGCNARTRVFRRGDEVPATGLFVRGTSCVQNFLQPGTAAFLLGEEVPPERLVKAARVVEPTLTGAPLHLVRLEAEDGASQPTSWESASTGEACRPVTLADGRLHCVTSSTPSTTSFADAACTQPAAFVSACNPATTFAEVAGATCPPTYTVHKLGERLRAGYSNRYSSTCTGLASEQYYAIGDPVSADAFPALQVIDDPSGRPRRRYRTSGGPLVDTGWFDAERGESCRPSPAGDKLRCRPDGLGLSAVFADSACTQHLYLGTRGICPPRFAFSYDRAACPLRGLTFAVGPEYRGTVYSRTTNYAVNPPAESCAPASALNLRDVPHIVTPIPESDLPELTVVTD